MEARLIEKKKSSFKYIQIPKYMSARVFEYIAKKRLPIYGVTEVSNVIFEIKTRCSVAKADEVIQFLNEFKW